MQSGRIHRAAEDTDAFCRFSPFEDPVATDDGYVFDILNIMPYIQTFKKHPVTGVPLKLSDLTKLTVHTPSAAAWRLSSLRGCSEAGVV